MKKFYTALLIAFAFLMTATFNGCANKKDDNYLWLLSMGGDSGGSGGGTASGEGGPETSPESGGTSAEAVSTETSATGVDQIDENATESVSTGTGESAGTTTDAIETITIDQEIAIGAGGSSGAASESNLTVVNADATPASSNLSNGGGSNGGNNGNANSDNTNNSANTQSNSGSDTTAAGTGNDSGDGSAGANANANASANQNSTGNGAGGPGANVSSDSDDQGDEDLVTGDELDDGEDLADGDPEADATDEDEEFSEDLADTDDESDAEGAVIEDAGEGAVACGDRRIELDTTAGKWYQTPQKNDGHKPSAADRKAVKEKIKQLQAQVKKLRASEKGSSKKDVANRVALLKKEMTAERVKLGFGPTQKGIHTYWANQALYLRVRNNCQAGWYKLKLVARNIDGPLPDDYSHFTVEAANETAGEYLGGIHVKASDKHYARGRMLVYLEKGDTNLLLNWKNDAYKKGEYDANIQIKQVALQYQKTRRARPALVRRAHQYCQTEGRWFWDETSARTYWADQRLSFCFPDLPSGKYEVSVQVKNYGDAGLPPGFKNFLVDLSADGVTGRAELPADDKNWKKGSTTLDLTGGRTRLDLVWRNDQWKEGAYDANIQIKKIRLKRVGDSDRSALAAYLVANAGTTGLLSVLLAMLACAGLLGLHFWKRRAEN